MTNNRILRQRSVDIGIISKKEALEWGCTGPVLRSAGVPWDREEVYENFILNNKDKKSNDLNAIELGYYANGIDLIVSGGVSKGYSDAWYDPSSHVYTFQNYGGGTSFGHFILKYDNKHKLFTGYESAVINQSSQTLFIHDFRYDEDVFDWINEKSKSAINQVYGDTDWNNSISSDSHDIDNKVVLDNVWDIPSINIKDNLDIITWNCEFFPTANDSTIQALSEAVTDLSPSPSAEPFSPFRKK